MRYHLHPLTGEPGKCRARKACPFGDLETGHYPTREAAREAFEERMKRREECTPPQGKQVAYHLPEVTTWVLDRLEACPQEEARALGLHLLKRLQVQSSQVEAWQQYAGLLEADLPPGAGRHRQVIALLREASYVLSHDESPAKTEWLRKLAQDRRKNIAFLAAAEEEEGAYHELLAKIDHTLAESEEEARARTGGEVEERLRLLSPKEWFTPTQELSAGEELVTASYRAGYEEDPRALAPLLQAGTPLYPGRVSGEDYREACEKLGKLSSELVEALAQEGVYSLPKNRKRAYSEAHYQEEGFESAEDFAGYLEDEELSPVEEEAVGSQGQFKLLAAGDEHNVYHHEESGMVFKVVSDSNRRLWTEEAQALATEEARYSLVVAKVQERYLSVNQERLGEVGARYLPTYFLTGETSGGQRVPVIAQPYLDPEDYVPFDGYSLDLPEEEAGVTDLHEGNVRVHKATGTIVLFDCIF